MLSTRGAVRIETDLRYRGRWIRVFVPYSPKNTATAALCDAHGVLLKQFELSEGHNSIDVTEVKQSPVHLKIETDFETIFKEINLV